MQYKEILHPKKHARLVHSLPPLGIPYRVSVAAAISTETQPLERISIYLSHYPEYGIELKGQINKNTGKLFYFARQAGNRWVGVSLRCIM